MKESIERHISFAGCGFIGIYHVGVSAFLKKYSSHLLNTKIGGSSAGAMCALALVSGDISLEEMTRNVLMLAHQASNKLMGPFNPTFNLHQILVKYFEDNLTYILTSIFITTEKVHVEYFKLRIILDDLPE